MLKQQHKLIALSITSFVLLAGCVVHVGGHASSGGGGEVSSVFGSVSVSEGKRVSDVSSVNGDVLLEDNVIASDVSTVNGDVEMGDNIMVDTATTVNGNIQGGENLHVFGETSTVNGNISLSMGSIISGDITTVNGDITLSDTEAKQHIITVNGDISLLGNTQVMGNIVFEETDDGWELNGKSVPVLYIDANVRLSGQIILKRAVTLHIDNPVLEEKIVRRGGSA
ncbi:hypothetical protein [Aestuariibacter sp. A3R04]|uniref:hypothetical protein n=1 Tax=Aestuariibacter sp. A3R04 TaxID=2841571 RepID=UPI001C080520|nr:hypothetical protein [Aestuariibacter sp. A3R04]MBU3022525.1 hypothetical protein [Aestuariibacter sp. A3R04]